jgi:hypothetical protein
MMASSKVFDQQRVVNFVVGPQVFTSDRTAKASFALEQIRFSRGHIPRLGVVLTFACRLAEACGDGGPEIVDGASDGFAQGALSFEEAIAMGLKSGE